MDYREQLTQLIQDYKKNKLKLLMPHEQAVIYEEIIDLCKEGYTEMAMSPKGNVLEVTKRDLGTATKALKDYREMLQNLQDNCIGDVDEEPMIVININELNS